MTKIKMIKLYKTDDVPDHIIQEVTNLVDRIAKAVGRVCEKEHPNIILSAMNRFHALVINGLVAESSLKEGAQSEAICLVRNVEHISGIKIFESEE